jgi:hypothetical protein
MESGILDSQSRSHFFIEKTVPWAIRLDPLSINDKLRNGAFAGALDHLVGGAGGGFNVDVFVRNVVLGEKTLCLPAIRTPGRGINDDVHEL